jgi:ubiquinone/menaquinone biosynthesis C-methylase UbiE
MYGLFFDIMLGAGSLLFLYFFSTTKLTIIANRLFPAKNPGVSHIYWIYRNKWLIRLTDRKALISAILLFQYNKLVDRIVLELKQSGLNNRKIIQTSCAFGDVTPRIVAECARQCAAQVVITDIVENELLHVKRKLADGQKYCTFVREDALNTQHESNSFDVVIMFFLLHELPVRRRYAAIREAARILKPGGKLIIAEFHQPGPAILKTLGWLYFRTFEPFALQIWKSASPSGLLGEDMRAGWDIRKETCFFDYFQIVIAEKAGQAGAAGAPVGG